jgi:hypothetical protein
MRFNRLEIQDSLIPGSPAPDAGTLGEVAEVSFWDPEHVFNNKQYGMRWAVCDAGARASDGDGTGVRAISLFDDADYEKGWWSEPGLPQWVQSVWPEPRHANRIVLNTFRGYANMAGVNVEYRDSGGGWNTVFNGTLAPDQYESSWDIPTTMITGLRCTVNSTYGGNWARLSELNALYVVDISEDVISINVEEVAEQYDSTVPMGITSANTFSIELNNIGNKYSALSPTSEYGRYIAGNNKIEIFFGVNNSVVGDTPAYEYTKVGEFYTDDWDESTDSMTVSVQGRDFSKFLQEDIMPWGKTWTNTTAEAVIRELLQLAGLPDNKIHITPTELNEFAALFTDEEQAWEFMGEIALADQATFKIDRNGEFFYRSASLPRGESVTVLSDAENIASATLKTQLYTNKVKIDVDPYSVSELERTAVWQAPNPSFLTWGTLASSIGATDTTINLVYREDIDEFPDKSAYIFIPDIKFQGTGSRQYPVVTAGELIKYKTRTGATLIDCERGALNTVAASWDAGAYVGECKYYDIEFNKSPVMNVRYPYVTAIDGLISDPEEGTPQAYIVFFQADAYKAKLAISNLVEGYTILSGTGQSYREFINPNSGFQMEWALSIAGEVPSEKSKQKFGSESAIARTF